MKYVKQFSIILGIPFLAELLEILIPLPIAASVYGLVIMLVGLITKLIPLEKVEMCLRDRGMDNKSAMKQVAKDRGVGKREIYQYLHGNS